MSRSRRQGTGLFLAWAGGICLALVSHVPRAGDARTFLAEVTFTNVTVQQGVHRFGMRDPLITIVGEGEEQEEVLHPYTDNFDFHSDDLADQEDLHDVQAFPVGGPDQPLPRFLIYDDGRPEDPLRNYEYWELFWDQRAPADVQRWVLFIGKAFSNRLDQESFAEPVTVSWTINTTAALQDLEAIPAYFQTVHMYQADLATTAINDTQKRVDIGAELAATRVDMRAGTEYPVAINEPTVLVIEVKEASTAITGDVDVSVDLTADGGAAPQALLDGARWRLVGAHLDGGMTGWAESGDSVLVTAGDVTLEFSDVCGYDTPLPEDFTLTPLQSVAKTGDYTTRTLGTLTVNIGPPEVLLLFEDPEETQPYAAWEAFIDPNDYKGWKGSGETVDLCPGTWDVRFYDEHPDWTAPADLQVTIGYDDEFVRNVVYTPNDIDVTVTLTPQGAIDDGAQWTIDGGSSWNNSLATVQATPLQQYTLEFSDVAGWTTPADQVFTPDPGTDEPRQGDYAPIAAPVATLEAVDGFYTPGETVQVSGTFEYPGDQDLTALTWTFGLPAGWTLDDVTGDASAGNIAGAAIVFPAGRGLSSNRVTFTATLTTSVGSTGDLDVNTTADYTLSVTGGGQITSPDDLPAVTFAELTTHPADTNKDEKIGIFEFLQYAGPVAEAWQEGANGGEYIWDGTTLTPKSAGRGSGRDVPLIHPADTNGDLKIGIFEYLAYAGPVAEAWQEGANGGEYEWDGTTLTPKSR